VSILSEEQGSTTVLAFSAERAFSSNIYQ